MTMYNQNFKQQVVDFYFEHHKHLPYTLRHFDLKENTVRRWIAQFKHSGSDGLAVLGRKQTYSTEFKFEVIQAVLKPKGHPTMKPKYAKMPPPPKTE